MRLAQSLACWKKNWIPLLGARADRFIDGRVAPWGGRAGKWEQADEMEKPAEDTYGGRRGAQVASIRRSRPGAGAACACRVTSVGLPAATGAARSRFASLPTTAPSMPRGARGPPGSQRNDDILRVPPEMLLVARSGIPWLLSTPLSRHPHTKGTRLAMASATSLPVVLPGPDDDAAPPAGRG